MKEMSLKWVILARQQSSVFAADVFTPRTVMGKVKVRNAITWAQTN
jgi:hypothetical protein